MDSVFLRSPLLIALMAAALAITAVSLIWRQSEKSGMCISFTIVAGALAYALVLGASLSECAAVSMIFFLLNLVRIMKRGERVDEFQLLVLFIVFAFGRMPVLVPAA